MLLNLSVLCKPASSIIGSHGSKLIQLYSDLFILIGSKQRPVCGWIDRIDRFSPVLKTLVASGMESCM